MPSFLHKISLAATIFATCALGQGEGNNVIPYSDGQCTQPLTNFTYTDQTASYHGFNLGGGVTANDGQTLYENLVFEGAAAPDNEPGYAVYWNPGTINPGCHAIFMNSYQDNLDYDQVVTPQPHGNIILNVDTEGCYYTNLPVSGTLMMTFCCGTGDCGPYNAGNQALSKRDLDSSLGVYNREVGLETPKPTAPEPAAAQVKKRSGESGLSVTSRASKFAQANRELEEKRGSTCAPTDTTCLFAVLAGCQHTLGDSFQAAGPQRAVSDSITCQAGVAGGTCSISSSIGITSGTSVTNEQSFTTTSTTGFSVDVSAGTSWPMEAETSVGVSQSIALAWGKSTGKTTSNSTTVTVTSTEGIVDGMTAFLSFVPSYTCYSPTMTCNGVQNSELTICNPNLDTSGNPQGEAVLVYTS